MKVSGFGICCMISCLEDEELHILVSHFAGHFMRNHVSCRHPKSAGDTIFIHNRLSVVRLHSLAPFENSKFAHAESVCIVSSVIASSSDTALPGLRFDRLMT